MEKLLKKTENKVLGRSKEGSTVCISEKSANQHLSVCGRSGTGKSTAAINYVIKAAEAGEQTIIFNWHNCINKNCVMPELMNKYRKYVKVIDVARDGIALPLFDRLVTNSGTKEEKNVMIQRLAAVFNVAAKLTPPQERILFDAIKDIYEKNLYIENGIKVVSDWLEAQRKSVALNALSKIASFCEGNLFRSGNFLMDTHRIIELDLNNLEYDVQDTVIRFLLDYLLRIANKGAFFENGFNLLIDEAQNLDYSMGSTIYTLLNESRRLNLRLILAFPSLFTGAKRGMDVITQCGTALFFKPLESDIRKVAETVAQGVRVNSWVFSLSRLTKGECVATGTLDVNGTTRTKPITINIEV